MDHTDYSVPYEQYKQLCALLKLEPNIYNYKKSFQEMIDKIVMLKAKARDYDSRLRVR
jgi:hypothetical protein